MSIYVLTKEEQEEIEKHPPKRYVAITPLGGMFEEGMVPEYRELLYAWRDKHDEFCETPEALEQTKKVQEAEEAFRREREKLYSMSEAYSKKEREAFMAYNKKKYMDE